MPTKRFRFDEDVEVEIDEALDYYKNISPKLEAKFAKELLSSFKTIQSQPKAFKPYRDNIRRYVMKHFPFLIFYEDTETELKILALFFSKGNPDLIDERLE